MSCYYNSLTLSGESVLKNGIIHNKIIKLDLVYSLRNCSTSHKFFKTCLVQFPLAPNNAYAKYCINSNNYKFIVKFTTFLNLTLPYSSQNHRPIQTL